MLYTIGYEGARLEDFIAALREHGIDILIDVRERAQSRRKGFSKSPLSRALSEHRISYLHLRALGDPREGRLAARARKWEEFHTLYSRVIASEAAQAALRDIAGIVACRNAALMCFERRHEDCHRNIVAICVAELSDMLPVHIKVPTREVRGGRCG